MDNLNTRDTVMRDDDEESSLYPPTRFIVAIDFGTTYSSVAFAAYSRPDQIPDITIVQIESIDDYPDDPNYRSSLEVPTEEIWYKLRSTQTSDPEHAVEFSGSHSLLEDISDSESGLDSGEEDEEAPNPETSLALPLQRRGRSTKNHDEAGARKPHDLKWGYEALYLLKQSRSDGDQSQRIRRPKLMLYEDHLTAQYRTYPIDRCRELIKLRILNSELDVISDFFERLLCHTRIKLMDYGYQEDSIVDFALTVPVIWNNHALRQMQSAMALAITKSGLGKLHNGSLNDLFLVAEPEAAALYLIESDLIKLTSGENFIILDAGGGTVDAITYRVSKSNPLVLELEEVPPGGAMCGSSFINERFEKIMMDRLMGESYLESNGVTLSNIINRLVVEFENEIKRKVDRMHRDKTDKLEIYVPGLRHSRKKRFSNGAILLNLKEARKLFRPSADGIATVMRNQIRMTREKGREVTKVFLTGGFGQSFFLREHLTEVLQKENTGISLRTTHKLTTAVAFGAVLRAAKKEHGPIRILQSSYGFLRTELYGLHSEHNDPAPVVEKVTGLSTIDNTVDWIIQKGDSLPNEYTTERKVEFTFPYQTTKKFFCTETLIVSDFHHKQHYRFTHAENKGAEVAGSIKADLSYLKAQNLIRAEKYDPSKPKYYKLTVLLRITVSGRNLKYEIQVPGDDTIHGTGQVCIAAAFVPGTV